MSRIEDAEKRVDAIERHTERIGHYMVDLFQFVALFVIGKHDDIVFVIHPLSPFLPLSPIYSWRLSMRVKNKRAQI